MSLTVGQDGDPARDEVAANLLASRSYRIRPYPGDAVLFMAEDYKKDHDHVVENWRALVGDRLEIRRITGLHNEIVEEPHVEVLARQLSDCLYERLARLPGAAD